MSAKVVSLSEATACIEDGSHVALGGFAITRNVVAAVHEIIRARKRDLTVSQVIGGMDTDLLVGAGCVRRLIYSGGSLDRFGFLNAVNAAVSSGSLAVQEYSSLALTLRFHAGAMGLPFVACRSMLGSDLLAGVASSTDVRVGEDPFTGTPTALLAPLRPDVAIVHVDTADERGNASLSGPTWAIRETALSARRVIVLCEEIVPAIPPDLVAIPGSVVQAVVAVPRGAHPTAVVGRYDYDAKHLQEYVRIVTEAPDGPMAYLDRYVLGVRDHGEYLARAEGDPL
jgi:acyl CoA:acetate/3-ketoacid CoA transferase alpha subunit